MHHKTKKCSRNALLAQLEESGGSAGNKALREAMEAALGREVSQEDYDEVKEELVAEACSGAARAKAVLYLAAADDDEDADDDFRWPCRKRRAKRGQTAQGQGRRARRPSQPAQSGAGLSPRRKAQNNPHVGMVDVASDNEESETTWAYDPHIDPALQFDPQRAGIEALIDDALASGDAAQMRAALEELKRMQSPYLNWAGKAERTSFEVDTVSLRMCMSASTRHHPRGGAKAHQGQQGQDGGRLPARHVPRPFENLPLSQSHRLLQA